MTSADVKNEALAQSRAEGADSMDGLSDPYEAVLNTISWVRGLGMSSATCQIGFVTINGKKAQVQICVETNSFNWVRV